MASEHSNATTHVPDEVLRPKLQIPARHNPQYHSPHKSPAAAGGHQISPINLKTNENNNKIKCEQTDMFGGDEESTDIGQGANCYDDLNVTNVVCKVGEFSFFFTKF